MASNDTDTRDHGDGRRKRETNDRVRKRSYNAPGDGKSEVKRGSGRSKGGKGRGGGRWRGTERAPTGRYGYEQSGNSSWDRKDGDSQNQDISSFEEDIQNRNENGARGRKSNIRGFRRRFGSTEGQGKETKDRVDKRARGRPDRREKSLRENGSRGKSSDYRFVGRHRDGDGVVRSREIDQSTDDEENDESEDTSSDTDFSSDDENANEIDDLEEFLEELLHGCRTSATDEADRDTYRASKSKTSVTGRDESRRQTSRGSKTEAASEMDRLNSGMPEKGRGEVKGSIDKAATGPREKANVVDISPASGALVKPEDTGALKGNPDKDLFSEQCGRPASVSHRHRGFKLSVLQASDDPRHLLLHLIENKEGLAEFLNIDLMSPDSTRKLLKIINRVAVNENVDSEHKEDLIKILHAVSTSRFFDSHLVIFIEQVTALSGSEINTPITVVDDIEMIQQLTTTVCHTFPSCASKGYLLLSYILAKENLMIIVRETKPSLEDDMRALLMECHQCTGREQSRSRAAEPRRRAGPDADDAEPPEDFSQVSVIPTDSDLDWTQRPFLRANKEREAFRDQDHYLDVQFRLLREDFVRPIREGIKEYKQKGYRKETKCGDLRMYYKVKIVGVACGDTLEHKLHFDTSHMKHVDWEHSKRLPYGGLLCLSNDDFETSYLAVVTNREPKDLAKGIIQVKFENGLDAIMQMKPDETLTMAETPAFFEAYHHVLKALQSMKNNPLPMARHIVQCQREIDPPKYLLDAAPANLNMSSFLNKTSFLHDVKAPALDFNKWPALDQTEFNASQLEAIRTALTKELAIIQGPPGTGKTFVGLKVARVLLDNKHIWTSLRDNRPILVVCYTNHALDQFLEGILKICPNGVVRVGSRCKNPALEKYLLKNVKRKKCCMSSEMRTCRDNLKELDGVVHTLLAQGECIEKGTALDVNALRKRMLPGQYESLTDICDGVLRSRNSRGLIDDWLAFGTLLREQNEETDPYGLLTQEVTSHILSGRDTCRDKDIRLNVHSLPFGTRAKLYRWWTLKTRSSVNKSCKEILSDEELRPFMSKKLYHAITAPLLKQHEQETNFCVRAWLGVQAASQDVFAIINGSVSLTTDENIGRMSVGSLPRAARVFLYRFWLKKYVDELKEKMCKKRRIPFWIRRGLKEAESGILPDKALKGVVYKSLFSAIQDDMLQRHAQQKRYMIKAWLGIAEFARDPQALEDVLCRLKGSIRDTPVAPLVEVNEGADGENEDDTDEAHGSNQFQQVGKRKWNAAELGRPDDAWTIPNWLRQTRRAQVQQALRKEKPMTEDKAASVKDLWDAALTLNDRVRLYLFWVQKHEPVVKKHLTTAGNLYSATSKKLQTMRDKEDITVLKESSVIGMTTTRAARYRRVLQRVACPIVILEEAAEVLEAHVVATLHESCQHLILIGDHQQLRPSPAVYDLCRHYHLDLSLFERLVNNNLHHTTLTVQHRMRPEVSRLVRHIYPHLEDHETTLNRPHIRGMKDDVFLLHHEVFEQTHEETSSKYNVYEAEMVMRLCKYLLLQGYEPNNITILAAYTGQILRLKSIMQASMFKEVLVTSVDNYQGEENEVIILSLVRSNQKGNVGFLGTDNRVCVALSRARNGLYAFGNFTILAKSSMLWRNVVATAEEHGQLGDAIVLRCENHPDTEIHASQPMDFDGAPEGGCKLPCQARLDCGHACTLICHGYDRDHKQFKCKKSCQRQVCEENLHPCPKLCHEECGKCVVMVEKTVPECGHKATIECSTDPATWICLRPCEEVLTCGHQCSQNCGNCERNGHVVNCTVQVERTWPCGHLVQFPCHYSPDTAPCYIPCDAKLDCGHICPGNCGACLGGRVHVQCKETCGKILKGCGHACPLPCGTVCLPCKKKCGKKCKHGECDHDCGEPCEPCEESCPRKCRHARCTATCDTQCNHCSQPCTKVLDCGHLCRGFCGERCVCGSCEKSRLYVDLSDGIVIQRQGRKEKSKCTGAAKDRAEGADGVNISSAINGRASTPEDNSKKTRHNTSSVNDQGLAKSEQKQTDGVVGSDRTKRAVVLKEALANTDSGENTGKDQSSKAVDCVKEKGETAIDVHAELHKEPHNVHKRQSDQTTRADDKATAHAADVKKKNRLIKLPSCGHIFDARALDDYVKNKLKSLSPGASLPCPACPKPILEHHCWRYQCLLRQRHFDMQIEKQKLIDTTEICYQRKHAIQQSFQTLLNMYCYTELLEHVKKLEANLDRAYELDINLAFALTNQCKLIQVVCSVMKLCRSCPQSGADTNRQLECLRTVLEKPVKFMSVQRCREMTAETRRLAYLTLLSYGLHLLLEDHSRNEDDIQRIRRFIQRLEHNNYKCTGPLPVDLDAILTQCRDRFPRQWFTNVDKAIRLEILDAPFRQDLCNILNPRNLTQHKSLASKSSDVAAASAERQRGYTPPRKRQGLMASPASSNKRPHLPASRPNLGSVSTINASNQNARPSSSPFSANSASERSTSSALKKRSVTNNPRRPSTGQTTRSTGSSSVKTLVFESSSLKASGQAATSESKGKESSAKTRQQEVSTESLRNASALRNASVAKLTSKASEKAFHSETEGQEYAPANPREAFVDNVRVRSLAPTKDLPRTLSSNASTSKTTASKMSDKDKWAGMYVSHVRSSKPSTPKDAPSANHSRHDPSQRAGSRKPSRTQPPFRESAAWKQKPSSDAKAPLLKTPTSEVSTRMSSAKASPPNNKSSQVWQNNS